jgi:hypothetical protein
VRLFLRRRPPFHPLSLSPPPAPLSAAHTTPARIRSGADRPIPRSGRRDSIPSRAPPPRSDDGGDPTVAPLPSLSSCGLGGGARRRPVATLFLSLPAGVNCQRGMSEGVCVLLEEQMFWVLNTFSL